VEEAHNQNLALTQYAGKERKRRRKLVPAAADVWFPEDCASDIARELISKLNRPKSLRVATEIPACINVAAVAENSPHGPKLLLSGVTGRDGYIIAQELAYAIEVIAALPEDFQEYSNREDMKRILAACCEEFTARHLRESAARYLFHPGSPLSRNTAIDQIKDGGAQ
jgi:hypothetical protein